MALGAPARAHGHGGAANGCGPPGLGNGTSIKSIAELCLPFRTETYITSLVEKILGEGIVEPEDLVVCSKEAMEMKLSQHAAFSMGELTDTMLLRKWVDERKPAAPARAPASQRAGAGAAAGGRDDQRRRPRTHSPRESRPPPRRRSRSHSGRRMPRRPEGRPFRGPGFGGGRRGDRGYGDRGYGDRGYGGDRGYDRGYFDRGYDRYDRGGGGGGGRGPPRKKRRSPAPAGPKPELWLAVEQGDGALVSRLLADGHNAEETHQGWTPLMKAAEEGHVEIIRLLLDRNVDLEAANRKGRTALSFAAAPSMKRPTPVAALRLLLERGADLKAEDDDGLVPKERAQREKRDEAVDIIEEFERNKDAGTGAA